MSETKRGGERDGEKKEESKGNKAREPDSAGEHRRELCGLVS